MVDRTDYILNDNRLGNPAMPDNELVIVFFNITG
jgi:hypothetical protein